MALQRPLPFAALLDAAFNTLLDAPFAHLRDALANVRPPVPLAQVRRFALSSTNQPSKSRGQRGNMKTLDRKGAGPRTVAATLALLGVWAVQGCGPSAPANGSGDAQTAEAAVVDGVTDTEVVFGTHSDLTGPIAIWGVGIVNGLRMRFDEANAAGGVHGRQLRLVVEDSQYQIPKAIAAANKLINRDKVLALLSSVGTQTNVAVMEQPFAKGVPNLFPATGARAMVEPFNPLVVSQMGLYYEEIRAGVKYFVEEKGRTTPCAIYHDTEYGHEIKEAVEDQTAAMGLSVAAVSAHKPTDVEFTAAVLRLRNAGCDLVMVGLVHRDTILVLETARKIGWTDVAWVGNEAAYGQVIADQKSGSGEGYYAFVPMALVYEDDDLAPPLQDWLARYRERYGEAPDLPPMLGYRAADLAIRALEIAGRELTRESLIAALESLTDYADIFGNRLSFGPGDHKGVDHSTLSQIQNGRWVTLDTEISY